MLEGFFYTVILLDMAQNIMKMDFFYSNLYGDKSAFSVMGLDWEFR